MTMKLTELRISPTYSYSNLSKDNPLRAVVKLSSEKSTIECVLGEDSMRKMLDLCADEIAAQAEARVTEFRDAVSSIDHEKDTVLLGGNNA